MPRIPRLPQSIDSLATLSSSRICFACRRRITTHSTTTKKSKSQTIEKPQPPQLTKPVPHTLQVPYEDVDVEEGNYGELSLPEDYKPADTWEGLEWVGGTDYIYEQKRLQRHNQWGQSWRGWAPAESIEDEGKLRAATKQAVTEMLMLHALGQPLQEWGRGKWWGRELWGKVQHEELKKEVEDVRVEVTDRVRYRIVFPSVEAMRAAVASLGLDEGTMQTVLEGRKEPTLSGKIEAQRAPNHPEPKSVKQNKHKDDTWERLVTTSLPLKFALMRRIFFLTGVRVWDSALQNAQSAKTLAQMVIEASKPRNPKLAEILETSPKLEGLGNVKVEERRITPIDKERAIGRWKIIEQELLNRGLPVTGN